MDNEPRKSRINRQIDHIQATISAGSGNSLIVYYADGGFDILPFALSVEELAASLVSAYRERLLL